MAEAFAVAAGVIGVTSLGVQLLDTSKKLQTLWHDYREAPEEVKKLAEELKIVHDLNEGIKTPPSIQQALPRDLLEVKCQQWCLDTKDSLTAVLKELDIDLSKRRKKASAKYALSDKARIEGWLRKLDRAKQMLLLARQLGEREHVHEMLYVLSSEASLIGAGVAAVQQSANTILSDTKATRRDVSAILDVSSTAQQHLALVAKEQIKTQQAVTDLAALQRLANERQLQQTAAFRQAFDEAESAGISLAKQHRPDEAVTGQQILTEIRALQRRADFRSTYSHGDRQNIADAIRLDGANTEDRIAHISSERDQHLVSHTQIEFEFYGFKVKLSHTKSQEANRPKQTIPGSGLDEVLFRVRLPLWFVEQQRGICITKATSGWKYAPRMYNVRPKDAPVFKSCRSGDVESLRMRFERGEASIYDVDVRGQNLMQASIRLASTARLF